MRIIYGIIPKSDNGSISGFMEIMIWNGTHFTASYVQNTIGEFKYTINTTASAEATIKMTEVNSTESKEEMKSKNDSVDLTTASAEKNSSSQQKQNRNVNTKFVMFMLVLIPVLYVMRKKGIV